ncbi:dipeptidase [Olivibacter sp. XZL3]|uniref:dipeptidase n=1 Tax=Olivibacter sp. XZL3 TaxID=1735116 RepID=UPI001066724C|nr:dipeptidase [Olivibacter sp. XZL3]
MKFFLFFICLPIANLVHAQHKNALHKEAIVVDLHNDVLTESIIKGKNIAKRLDKGHTDLPRLKEGGVDVQFFSVWCDEKKRNPFQYANKQIDALYELLNRNADQIVLAKNVEEIRKGVQQGKIVAMLGVEGGHMIEDRLANVDSLYSRGVRYLTLTWNNSTSWASSAADEQQKKKDQSTGLNAFGKQVVQRMNALGMVIDLSHVGEQTFYDVLEITKKPVFVSHSDVYAINPHYRNLKDEQIKAIAKNGGVIGVNFYADFLDPTFRKNVSSLYARHVTKKDSVPTTIDKKYQLLPKEVKLSLEPPLSLVVDHINYLVELAGIDHIGLGADFDGMDATPKGLSDVSAYPLLTEALIDCGYTEAMIRKILGGNVLRVLEAQNQ